MAVDPTRRVVALTGASNYLGQGLMRRLADDERCARIVAIDINKPEFEHPKLVYYKVDLTGPASQQVVSRLFQNEGVDTFAHLIFTYTLSRNRTLAHELEAIGTLHILDACSEAGVSRVVARSTTAIYGARPGNPAFLTEDHPVGQRGADTFTADKVEMERQMRQFRREHPAAKVMILRDCTSLGSTSMNYLSSILFARHSPRFFGHDPLMQFIHEDDLFRAYHMGVMGDAEGIFNIVGKGVLRYSEAIERAGGRERILPGVFLKPVTSLLWSLKLYDIPSSYLGHLKYPWVADGTRAAQVLDFVPAHDCFEALDDVRRVRAQRGMGGE